MRRAVLYGVAVVCLTLLFATAGPQAQRMISGNGNEASSNPVTVTVSNFPVSQAVTGVVEVAHAVNVTGSVAVTNFPAVQQVAGTVNVGNLPLDTDGNLKVAAPSSCPGHRSLFVKVTDGLPIGVAQASGTDVYTVEGWSGVQVFFRATFPVGNFQTCLSLTPAFGKDDVFAPAAWGGPQACYSGGNGAVVTGNVVGGPILGPQLKFLMGGSSLTATTLEIWLYLTD